MPAQLPTEFVRQIAQIQSTAGDGADAAGTPGLAGRPWNLPAGVASGGADLQDPVVLKDALVRDECSQKYAEALRGGAVGAAEGKAGALVAYKSAVDYLAAAERALQARHAPRARALRWAAARREGHGDARYGVFAAVLNDLNATLGATAGPT
jgi:hypothetical protein